LPSGTRLGPCEILVPPGAGGTSEVYKARYAADRAVAVKILSSLLRADIGSHARGEPVEPRASHGSSFDKLRTSGFVCAPAEARPLPPGAAA